MSFRGRGRGRFGRGGGGGFGFSKQEPFEFFPEVELPRPKDLEVDSFLISWNNKLVKSLKSSPYYLEETVTENSHDMDIERYADWGKPKDRSKYNSLNEFMILQPENIPKELLAGMKRKLRDPKKARWDLDSDMQKIDNLERLEQKFEGHTEKKEKENKEGEEEEENEDDELEGQSEEEFSDDDYNQNVDFDDDEDDYNVDDENDDEPTY